MALIHAAARRLIIPKSTLSSRSSFSSVSLHPQHRIHLLFGANTDVGKSIISTGLVRAAAATSLQQQHELKEATVNYIKPLQCGGSDESFVIRNNNTSNTNRIINSQTLFRWETPASPHLASRWENLPVSDEQVISSLQSSLRDIDNDASSSSSTTTKTTIIETAGGVLSPSSSSPLNNNSPSSADDGPSSWGWSTQADLYAPLNLPVIFVGDGKLGGISVTLASLEALWSRGYQVDAIVFIEGDATGDDDNDNDDMIQFGKGNTEALREYMNMRCNNEAKNRMIEDESIICLPSLPPMPIPLDDWYDNNQDEFLKLHQLLCRQWKNRVAN